MSEDQWKGADPGTVLNHQGKWSTRLLLKMPYGVYAPVHFGAGLLRARQAWRAASLCGYGRLSSLAPSATTRSSDTLYILGSGSSINRLTDAQWSLIKQADSLGLSFWPIHSHVPTFLSLEVPRDTDRSDVMYALLEARARAYRHVPIIIKASHRTLNADRLPPSIRSNLYHAGELILPARDVREFRRSLTLLDRTGVLRRALLHDAVPMTRASVTFAIFLGLLWGYREIVLCGVDLKSTAYFYEEYADKYRAAGIPIPRSGQTGSVHRTADPAVHELTLPEIVTAVNELLLLPTGIRLSVASRESALFPSLPYHFGVDKTVGPASSGLEVRRIVTTK